MRIRAKFSLLAGLVLIMSVAALAAAAYALQRRMIERHLAQARMTTSSGWAAVCRQALTVNNDLFMVNYVKLLQEQPEIAYAYFADSSGKILVHSDKRFIYKTLRDWLPNRPGRTFDATVQVQVAGRAVGDAVIGFSEEYQRRKQEELLRDILTRVAAAAAGVALAGLLLAFLFAHMLARPIRTLSSASEEIGKGNFNVQVRIDSSDELGELSGRFNQMAKNLAILDELKDEFISMVSHDLRNPLAAITMYIDFMLKQGPDHEKIVPKHREYLNLIAENARRLGIFVTNVLDAAKIKAGRMEYHLQPVALDGIARNLQALFGVMAGQMKVMMLLDIPSNLPPVLADPERLDHVIANLASNALKFTPEGGRITFGARAAGNTVEVYVADTGKGISPEDKKRLFQRFSQVGDGRRQPKGAHGTGLGLYIVKQTVDDMGGRIEVESEEGRGTRFTVTLPAAPANK